MLPEPLKDANAACKLMPMDANAMPKDANAADEVGQRTDVMDCYML